ncbi:hypothetical protein FW755_09100 [Lonepinella koalarum]|uniref:hypothetical protein n=1 Tax=Lonepinella koalarum TaxID=53417 RepID=UPI0011E4208B|nr:hypothetical protein [Lonepinella koalarum]TYG35234.1 hypothetical protein FW755_09100 [Lonepinella koalarum]
MNKKFKFLLRLSALALVAGVAAQFYTNYQIDQTISKFPYQLKDQFNITITEKNSDFFTRDLTFSIEEQNGDNTDFMHTKLTALPLMISAESIFNSNLIKQLNEQLNITIDKNTITSQFSVFSDSLSSRVLTEFRDSTNQSQTLESQLSYHTQSKSIELQTELSAFNYDKLLKISELKGEFLLTTVGDNLYDLIKADFKTKKIDINLLDGDDTHFGLVKGHYMLDKKINDQQYDLNQQINQQGIYVSNKNTKSDQDKPRAEDVKLTLKRQNIPSHVTFPEQLRKLQAEQFNLTEMIKQFIDFVFNNQQIETELSINHVVYPKDETNLIDAQNIQIVFSSNHQDRKNAAQTLNLKAKNILFKQDDEYAFTDVSGENKISHLNLENHLAFLTTYLPKSLQTKEVPQKDTPKFLADLEKLAENFQTRLESAVKIQKVSIEDKGLAENVQWNYVGQPTKDVFYSKNNLSLDKIAINQQQMQFGQLKWDFPLEYSSSQGRFYQAYLCKLYHAICSTNLMADSYINLAIKQYSSTPITIPKATLVANVDTYPSATQALPISLDLTAEIPNNNDNISIDDILEQANNTLEQGTLQINGTVPLDFVKAEKPNTEFWQSAVLAVKMFFAEKEDKYQLNANIHQDKLILNGESFVPASETPLQNQSEPNHQE